MLIKNNFIPYKYTVREYRTCTECKNQYFVKVVRSGSKCWHCNNNKWKRKCEYKDQNDKQCVRIHIRNFYYKRDGVVHCDRTRSDPDAKRMCLDHAHKVFGITINDIQQLIKEVFI